MNRYHFTCSQYNCGQLVEVHPKELIILIFSRLENREYYLFRDCPICNATTCAVLDSAELDRFRTAGTLILTYSLDASTDRLIENLLKKPRPLTIVEVQLAGLTILDGRQFRRALDRYIHEKGTPQNP